MSCLSRFHAHPLPRLQRTTAVALLPAGLALLALAGCGIAPQNFAALPGPSAEIKGTVHGGRAPITGINVQVWAAGTTGYGSPATLLAQTTTDGNGGFGFPASAYVCPQGDTPVYLTGQGGNPGLPTSPNSPTLVLAAGLSNCTGAKTTVVGVNEVTTIATAYALAQFFTPTLGNSSSMFSCAVGSPCAVNAFGGPTTANGNGALVYSTGLINANSYTIPTLVNIQYGSVRTQNPNVFPEGAKIYTLANALANCVNSTGGAAGDGSACGSLFADTTPPGGTAPTDTLQAAVQMALHPYQHATDIYNLGGSPTSPFQFSGGLTSPPADLTVGVAYTSNAFKLSVSPAIGTSNLAIDAAGKVWLPSTSPAGIAVFDPSTTSFSGPFTSATTNVPQSIAIDHEGLVWVPDTSGIQGASFTTTIPSTSNGYATPFTGATFAVTVASDDTVLLPLNINGIGSGVGAITYPRAAPFLLTATPQHQSTSITASSQGANFFYLATQTGSTGYMEVSQNQTASGPTTIRLTTPGGSGQIVEVQNPSTPASPDFVMTSPLANTACSYLFIACVPSGYYGMNGPQGLAVDGANYVWVANSSNASVTEIAGYSTTSPYSGGNSGNPLHGPANGNTMVQPFGIGIDPSGNVWVSNQTAAAAGSPYVLSELVGAGAPTITPVNTQIYGGVNRVGTRP